MDKVLLNKIITVTDTCAVWANTFCWCDTVCIYISFVHDRLHVITIQNCWIVRVATQICDINFMFEGRICFSLMLAPLARLWRHKMAAPTTKIQIFGHSFVRRLKCFFRDNSDYAFNLNMDGPGCNSYQGVQQDWTHCGLFARLTVSRCGHERYLRCISFNWGSCKFNFQSRRSHSPSIQNPSYSNCTGSSSSSSIGCGTLSCGCGFLQQPVE